MFNLEDFVAGPTIKVLTSVTCDQFIMIAGHYKIEVTGSPAKGHDRYLIC